MALKMVGPGLLGFRLPLPEDYVRFTYRGAAAMFWVLGEPEVRPPEFQPSARLAALPADERQLLLYSLAQTLDRVVFYRNKFDAAVALLIERKHQVGATIAFDTFGPYLYHLLGPLLTCSRSFVDEVVYICARLNGESIQNADAWSPKSFKDNDSLEARLLFVQHNNWFELLNAYRNALVHRGQRNAMGGYFPPDSELPEAKKPFTNFMLIPDQESLRRPNRPHQWTYNRGQRLEHLVAQISDGLEKFAIDIGHLWGGTVPAPGTIPEAEHPNILVSVPKPALVFHRNIAFWPIFTTRTLAEKFHFDVMNSSEFGEPFEVLLCYYTPVPGFIFSMTSKDIEVLETNGIEMVWMILDPQKGPTGFPENVRVIDNTHLAILRQRQQDEDKVCLPASNMPGIESIYIIRTVRRIT